MSRIKSYKFKLCGVEMNVTIEEKSVDSKSREYEGKGYQGTHYHAGFEWFFVFNSPLSVYTDNGCQEFENSLVSIPPHFEHTTNNRDNFKFSFTFKPAKDANSDFFAFLCNTFSPDKITTANYTERALALILELESAFKSDLEISDEMAEALIKLVFSDIFLANAKKIQTRLFRGTADYLVKIDNIIGDFKSDITLTDVANSLGVCPRQASRIIKKNYGSTLSELIERKRLGIAKDLLKTSDMSISDIVEYINFSSESYFYSRFKKVYGVTPRAYRKHEK